MHRNIWTIIPALQYSGTVAAALLCSSYSKLTRIFVIIVNLGAISWSHEQTVGTLAAYYQTRCESFDGVYISFSCNNMKMGLRVTKKYMAAYLEVPLYLIVTLWRYDTNSRIFLEFWGQSLERGLAKIWNGGLHSNCLYIFWQCLLTAIRIVSPIKRALSW